MIHGIFTVFDSKANAFLLPFFSQNERVAVRQFTTTCRSDGHPFNDNPADYTLYYLGDFDDTSGLIQNSQKKAVLTGPEALASISSPTDQIQ